MLASALSCDPSVRNARRSPVLLTPAFSSAATSYGWNYLPQLRADGIPTCSISVSDDGYGDLQKTAEYVVYAVRRMARMSGRKVILLGHQHGALDELWALTFWPDIARRVSDLVSLETPYNGTTSSITLCAPPGHCTPALRQITKGSRFLTALRKGRRPRGPAITSIASKDDALITPEPAASRLRGARNVVLQDVCPGRKVDHFAALADNVGYELFLDAIHHAGPADPARLAHGICSRLYMPLANSAVLQAAGAFLALFAQRNAADTSTQEPSVARYARPAR